MVRRFWIIIALSVVLLSAVILEQIYTDNAVQTLINNTQTLQTSIENENLTESKQQALEIKEYWDNNEVIISMFVDYRDIEQIGRQIELVNSHLDNEDFELAKVECNLLLHITTTFKNTIGFDWQNII
ncbi:MAG: DUF4363 family protein [Clostridia bacterium]|nr:DUF4363 family protein [Clostridia bacterium]